MKEQIKSRILIEMQNILTREQLVELKGSLDRNLYGYEINKEVTDLTIKNYYTNEQMLMIYYNKLIICGKSERTIEQYMYQLKVFFGDINKNWFDITNEDIIWYFSLLIRKGSLSKISIENRRRCIKPFFNFLVDNDYIYKNPMKNSDKIICGKKKKEYLTDDEIVRLKDSVIKSEKKEDIKIRDLAIIDFLISTGLRVSEIVNLKRSDVDFINGTVNVYSSKTREYRIVYLDSNAKKHLQDYLSNRKDYCSYLFKGKNNKKAINKSTINNIVGFYGKKAYINKHCTVHLLRKTLATKLYKKGMDVAKIAKILGHNSVKTTEEYYLTICEDEIRNNYKSLC